jgi:hypothetical protein
MAKHAVNGDKIERPMSSQTVKKFLRSSTVHWILVGAVTLALVVAHVCWPDQVDNTVILLCLFAIAPLAIPVLSKYVKSAEIFGAKIKFLERRLDELYFLSIGDKLMTHVTKLAQPGGYGECFVGTALPRELTHLENLGYIRFKAGLKGIDDFLTKFNWQNVPNLSDYVEITPVGARFLEESQAKPGDHG